jgi:hypothetical protein
MDLGGLDALSGEGSSTALAKQQPVSSVPRPDVLLAAKQRELSALHAQLQAAQQALQAGGGGEEGPTTIPLKDALFLTQKKMDQLKKACEAPALAAGQTYAFVDVVFNGETARFVLTPGTTFAALKQVSPNIICTFYSLSIRLANVFLKWSLHSVKDLRESTRRPNLNVLRRART